MTSFVDANVIIWFLTGHPPEMAEQTRSLMAEVHAGRQELIVDELVVAEVVWVLQSFYEQPRSAIALALQEFLLHDGLVMSNKSGVLVALNLYSEKNVDFIDALLTIHMQKEKIENIFSFDCHFDRLEGIARVIPGDPLP